MTEDSKVMWQVAKHAVGEWYDPMSTWNIDQLSNWLHANNPPLKDADIHHILKVSGIDGNKLANCTIQDLKDWGLKQSRAGIIVPII